MFTACISFCSVAFISCDENESVSKSYVNSWILENMKAYYYWNTYIPSNPDMEQYPDNFFYSLLYRYQQIDGDRFSWIQENYVDLLESLSGVSSGDLGFEYTLIRYDDSNVFGEVLYVKPGTGAEAQGVKRGNAFRTIDGTQMTVSNYSALLQKSSMRITFADPSLAGNLISFENERDITITKTRYAENPIFVDSIYFIHGKKIGYLVYNFFAGDSGDDSKTYDKQLNTVFGKFKSAGVDNVIVDLRYNSGGSTISAMHLASMLASPLNTNDVFYKLIFNNNLTDENVDVNFSSKIRETEVNINNIGDNLQKVCFITSQWSASASEMVILGLQPFMNSKIIIAGDTTVGKSYASVSFYEENNPQNKWGMQPLVAKYTNGNGDLVPATGFIPNHFIKETFIIPKKALGDINEALLNAALSEITGQPVSDKTQRQWQPSVKVIDASVNKKAYSNHAVLEKIK
jgi:C-terminal processing protease CtpA/Prc